MYVPATVEPLDADVCWVLRLPNVPVVHARSQEFISGIVLSARLPGVLSPHHVPCSHGELTHNAR